MNKRRFRVIVTGSRDWWDRNAIYRVLNDLLAEHGELVVVHGACPPGLAAPGADQIADDWCIAQRQAGAPVFVERHPANWSKERLAAGPIRNTEMVALGANLCLAFILPCNKRTCRVTPQPHDSHGTTDCADKARAAGIEVDPYHGTPDPRRRRTDDLPAATGTLPGF